MSDIGIITANSGDERKKKFFSVVDSVYKAGTLFSADCATYSATAGFIAIDNGITRGEITNGNVIVVPDYIKISCVTGTATGDGLRFIFSTDITKRWSSGGSSLTTLAANTFVDTYSSFERITAAAQVHAGDLTLSAASSASAVEVFVGRPTFGATPALNGDEHTFVFEGAKPSTLDGAVTVSPVQSWHSMEPVFLGPGSSLIGHIVMDATSAATEWKVSVGWTELHHDLNA